MTDSSYTLPLPIIDPLTAPYWEHAWNHQLSVQQCQHCGDLHFPPCEVCPVCLCDEQDWHIVSGRARLVSWVRFHRAYWDGYRNQLPYDVCLVQLEEGPLILSNFVSDVPADVHMGMPLQAVFDTVAPNVSLVRFEPAKS